MQVPLHADMLQAGSRAPFPGSSLADGPHLLHLADHLWLEEWLGLHMGVIQLSACAGIAELSSIGN